MCGIGGVLHFDKSRHVTEELLKKMSDSIEHRGPDDSGIYMNGSLGLVFRRLSILDLSANGHQPFASEDGRYHIVFNGEIYNFDELKPDLEKVGFKFHSKCDTEVLLYLFINEGPAMLDKLNGMFAFCIWDKHEQSLFIARDQSGIKPLYFATYLNSFYFGSEQKALIIGGVSKEINETQLNELVLYRFISGEKTIYKHIRKLLPGHYIIVKDGEIAVKRWWNLSEKIMANRNRLPKDLYGWFSETFVSSLEYRMISDVPVGVLLSGGLDSSSILAGLYEKGYSDLSTFTVGFDEKTYNEASLAKKVAHKFKFNFHEIRLDADQVYDSLIQSSWFHDEPLVHQNDPHILALSRYAKNHVSVLLSGEAADELMGGYVRYKPLKYLNYKKVISPLLGIISGFSQNPRFQKLMRFYEMEDGEGVLVNSCSLYPKDFHNMGIPVHSDEKTNEYRSIILNEARCIFPNDSARQAMYLDQHTFMCSLLERNDKMTMGASIECRVPFLDHRLVEMIGAMPSSCLLRGKKGKYLLYNSVAKRLPIEVRDYKKNGFAVPWENYLNSNDRFKLELEKMTKNPVFEAGILKCINIKDLIDGFKSKRGISTVLLRQMIMIHFWFEYGYKRL